MNTAGFLAAEGRLAFRRPDALAFAVIGRIDVSGAEVKSRNRLEKFAARSENMILMMKKLWTEEEGQDLTEYALIVILVALAAIAGTTSFGTTVTQVFSNAAVNVGT